MAKKRGRKLIHKGGGKERQREYNKRKKLKKLNLPDVEQRQITMDSTQRAWSSRNDFKTLYSQELPERKSKLYIVKSNKTEEYFVLLRGKDYSTGQADFVHFPFQTYELALDECTNIINSKKLPAQWMALDEYLPSAVQFIDSIKEKKLVKGKYQERLGFILALSVVRELGCTNMKGLSENLSDGYKKSLLNGKKAVLRIVGNDEIKDDMSVLSLQDLFYSWFVKIANYKPGVFGHREVVISEGTFNIRTQYIIRALEHLKHYPEVFPNLSKMTEIAIAKKEEVRKQYFIRETSKGKSKGSIRGVRHYGYIDIKDLLLLLDHAWNTSIYLYNYIILSLTVGLRPSEMKRLLSNPQKYILQGALNYKGKNLADNDVKLVVKTWGSVDVTKLPNPLLSPVGRLLLFHNTCRLSPVDYFKNKNNYFRKEIPCLSSHVERSLRATCATMLSLCQNATNVSSRASLPIIKARLAHKDLEMAISTYAPNMPFEGAPELYFNLPLNLKLSGIDVSISEHSPLWDVWLLRDYMQRYLNKFANDPQKQQELRALCAQEVKSYQLHYAGDSGIAKEEMI